MTITNQEMLDRLDAVLKRKLFNYHIRYYEAFSRKMPPPLAFLVIDSEEVILAEYRGHWSGTEGEIGLSIKHPDVIKLFRNYYDHIWHDAEPIKEGDYCNRELLEKIRQGLIGQ